MKTCHRRQQQQHPHQRRGDKGDDSNPTSIQISDNQHKPKIQWYNNGDNTKVTTIPQLLLPNS